MVLKDYQIKVVKALKRFYTEAEKKRRALKEVDENLYVEATCSALNLNFGDRPKNGLGKSYPRFCIKVPTAGGKTLLAIEAIREYQNIFAKKRTGLIVWITHRETIYRQTIEKLRDKNHIYRQWLDQCSSNRTLIIEKGQPIRKQDTDENLVILMLMIQSASRTTKENMKVFQDSGGYIEFFPPDNQYNEHQKLLEKVPNLDTISDKFSKYRIIKTSLGNVIRTLDPLIIVDEFHTMFSDIAKDTLDGLNPTMIIGLSATPKERKQMNVLIEITGKQLERAGMIKLDMHLHSPERSEDWHEMINKIKKKREALDKITTELDRNKGVYIRPIVLIQAERTGSEQRGKGFVHSEDVREHLIKIGVPSSEIAVKSSELDEIKEQKLLSRDSGITYIITKEALKEGWDCSFAYILGVIPSAKSKTSMTQLVGRILRQPYAKKLGIPELDESYVYFTKGATEEVFKNIKRGFEQEGLGDLFQNVTPESGPTGTRKIKIKIKKKILNKYPESLYLPVWTVKEGSSYRKFSYETDIKPRINWKSFNYRKWIREELFPLLDEQSINYELLISLDSYRKRYLYEENGGIIEISYLTRRISDVIDNAFVAYDLASNLIEEFKSYKNQKRLKSNTGFLIQEIIKKLSQEKERQESIIFDSLIQSRRLILTISPDKNIGYSLPKESEIYPERVETFRLNLFEKSDILSMNPLEKKVADLIDEKKNILWWVRNIAQDKRWYAIRGWKEGKIHPDFIVAKKNKNDSLELVCVIESKGEHLIGNPDTQYKKAVFDKMNVQKVEGMNLNLVQFKLNNKFEFELVEQGKEELEINKFFNL